MTIKQPIATDKQSDPDHSLSHRVFANDDGASAKTIVASTGGKVGVGVDAPTAILHLKAGTAAANTQQIKLDASTLLTIPEAGSVEFSDGRFYITGTGKQRAVDRSSSNVAVADVTVTTTATETTLYSWDLSANAMKVGRIYKVHLDGVFNSASNKTLTLNFYVGGVLYVTSTTTPGSVASPKPWEADYHLTIRTVGSDGTSALHRTITLNDVTSNVASLQAIDTTGGNAITFKAKWSDNNAGNSITLQQAYLEFKN